MNLIQQSNSNKPLAFASPKRRFVAACVFLAIAGGGVFLWFAGHYKITLYPFACGFRQRYGLPCPTCGYTTAAIAFFQGHIAHSFYTQPAAAGFCCIAVIIAIFALPQAVFGIYSPVLESRFASVRLRYIAVALAIIIVAGWGVTLTRALIVK